MHQQGFYEKYVKRLIDIVLSITGLVVLSPIMVVLTFVGAIVMKGNPFLHSDDREKMKRFLTF